MNTTKHFDIAIIGKGITGLSSGQKLRKSGYSLAFFETEDLDSTSDISANLIMGGMIDNFTRISQRHGLAIANDVWNYCDQAFEKIKTYALEHQISLHEGERVRLIETLDEKVESLKAIKQLQSIGKPSFWVDSSSKTRGLEGIQNDGPKAAWIDKANLIQSLKLQTQNIPSFGKVQKISKQKDAIELHLDNELIHADAVILACHLGIKNLLPNLKSIIVSSQDQWARFSIEKLGGFDFPSGSVITWRHGHYWALRDHEHSLVLGGARFLRPLAGFEAEKAELNPKVLANLASSLNKYFPDFKLGEMLSERAGLDIRPCDELPVIGPMFGEQGIFVATGFMGQGLSLGFMAGQSLGNLVLGERDELPRALWPERHRSLGNGET